MLWTVLVPFGGVRQSATAFSDGIDAFPDASITAIHGVDIVGDPDLDIDRGDAR